MSSSKKYRFLASDEECIEEIKEQSYYMRAHLGLDDAEPSVIVRRLDELVNTIQQGETFDFGIDEFGGDDPAYFIGSLWGEQLLAEFGWKWTFMEVREESNLKKEPLIYIGVTSENRSSVIFAFDYVSICLSEPSVDCTIMAVFNYLRSPEFHADEVPGAMCNLMETIHRIIPRR